jgi:hypothetical protein
MVPGLSWSIPLYLRAYCRATSTRRLDFDINQNTLRGCPSLHLDLSNSPCPCTLFVERARSTPVWPSRTDSQSQPIFTLGPPLHKSSAWGSLIHSNLRRCISPYLSGFRHSWVFRDSLNLLYFLHKSYSQITRRESNHLHPFRAQKSFIESRHKPELVDWNRLCQNNDFDAIHQEEVTLALGKAKNQDTERLWAATDSKSRRWW